MTIAGFRQTDTLNADQMALVQRELRRDPLANAYALADLQPRFAPHCRWLVEQMPGNGAEHEPAAGVVLFFLGLEPPIVMAAGDDSSVAAALARAQLPPTVYMSVAPAIHDLLAAYYDFGDDVRRMARMALPAGHPLPTGAAAPQLPPDRGLVLRRLSPGDAPQLEALYALGGDFAPDSFDAYQLGDGTFFGVTTTQGQLIAAGGTHITAPPVPGLHPGIAAIGNMYTHPGWRGQGLARVVLAAVVSALRHMHIDCIVLNVDMRNRAARRLYENFGFYLHCEYLEGSGVLQQ